MSQVRRKLFPRAPLFAHIKLACRRRKLYLATHGATPRAAVSRQLRQVLLLRRLGLVAHLESTGPSMGRPTSRGYRVMLRYRRQASTWNLALLREHAGRVTIAALECFEAQGGGATLLISTECGVYTHRECIQRR